MIKSGELAQMKYLRQMVGLIILDCETNCNILNRRQNNWESTAERMITCPETKEQNNLDTVCILRSVHFIIPVQQIHNIFIKIICSYNTAICFDICISFLCILCSLKLQTDKMQTVKKSGGYSELID
jgi:hypothetical protein